MQTRVRSGSTIIRAGIPAFVLVSAAVAVTLSGCGKRSAEAVVARRNITAYLPLQGTIVAPPAARADIYSPYTAPVSKVYVTVGKTVRRGEALVDFSAQQTAVYYDQARAALLQAQKALKQAQSQYGNELKVAEKQLALSRAAERSARAVASTTSDVPGGSGPADIAAATTKRQAAEQEVIDAKFRLSDGLAPYQQAVATAQQQFQEAQAGSKSAQVKSPISGTVLAVNVSAGATPDPENKKPLVTVVDLEALKVAAGIEEDQLSMLKPKNPAVVTIKEVPNVQFPGSVDQIYSEKAGFLKGQKFVVVADFKNLKGEAKPDMDATASIKIGEVRDVLAVPANAVFNLDKQQHAVKVREGKAWHQRVVEIGLSDGAYTEIKSGLKEGDVVMTNPSIISGA